LPRTMKPHSYQRPTTLEDALACKLEGGASLIAGGTDLVVHSRGRISDTPMISLRAIPELATIVDGDTLRIGATAPLADVGAHPRVCAMFPSLVDAIAVIGSRQIRNVATVGGNLCNASPGADTAPPLITFGARVELACPEGRREVAVEDFFTGPGETRLTENEIMTAILLDDPRPSARSVFLRKGRIKMDIALASLALLVELDGRTCRSVRIAAGAVAPVPLRLTKTEAALTGREIDDATINAACEVARSEVRPIDDIRTTAEYRRALIGVFLERGLREVLES